jgi:hypothetical protein
VLKKILIAGLILAVVIYLVHENDRRNKRQAEIRKANTEEKIQKNLNATPTVKAHEVNGGQVLILDIPYVDSSSNLFLESQRCFVWRDTLGSSISCPHQPNYLANDF